MLHHENLETENVIFAKNANGVHNLQFQLWWENKYLPHNRRNNAVSRYYKITEFHVFIIYVTAYNDYLAS